MAERVQVAVGLGSNVGDREAHLRFGRDEMARRGVVWTAISSIYETEPVGPVAEQGSFLNQVGVGETELPSEALLEVCLTVERARGRERSIRWGPRTLDLDILLYGDRMQATPELTVPHPEMARRAFVLTPLVEIAPEWIVPGTNRTVATLLAEAPGREGVRLWRSSATKRQT